MKEEKTDIKENDILKINYDILFKLLQDHTSNETIIWATDNYKDKGIGFQKTDHILINSITGYNGNIIRPRVSKSKKEQEKRIKDKAEVFTPSWICNKQNNLIDNDWFGEENIFNGETDNGWKTNNKKINFPTKLNKTWQDYIKDTRLEISCGEAPYLVSRYDNVTGNTIEIKDRIGFLDRKLRVINENVDNKNEWIEWVKTAYKNIYGFEFQGDNLLIARENLLYTFVDNYYYKFSEYPSKEEMLDISDIISYNIWQMDGLKFVIPYSCKTEEHEILSLFGNYIEKEECEGCKKNNYKKHNGMYCKIKNWETGRMKKFVSYMNEGQKNGK